MRLTVILFLIGGVAVAQVRNAADAAAGTFASTPLAPGSLAVIDCSCSAETTATVALRPVGVTTPTGAQVIKVVQGSITFLVPALPTGDAELIYKIDNEAVQWTRVSIVPSNFALYRSGPVGPLTATNGLVTPAEPGQVVVLWGTGLGATAQADVHVALGGVQQTVIYAGAAPGQPGLDQINFRIAGGTPDGCYVPLTVTYGSNSVTSFLSKTSDGSPCAHPFDLSVDAMKILDNGQRITTGEITITTTIQAPAADRASRQERATVSFLSLSASDVAGYFTGNSNGSGQTCGIPVSSGVFLFLPGFGTTPFGAMTLKSSTATLALPFSNSQFSDAPLNNLPAPMLNAGTWTWSTRGGFGLTASSFDFVLPPPIQIAGGAPLKLNPGQNQTIAWNATGYDSGATARLTLTERKLPPPLITCSVPAQTGSVTIPSNLLALFARGYEGALSVSAQETGAAIPHALLKQSEGSPLLMLVLWTSTDTRPVDFQ